MKDKTHDQWPALLALSGFHRADILDDCVAAVDPNTRDWYDIDQPAGLYVHINEVAALGSRIADAKNHVDACAETARFLAQIGAGLDD